MGHVLKIQNRLAVKVERHPRNQGRRPDAQPILPELAGVTSSDDLRGNLLKR